MLTIRNMNSNDLSDSIQPCFDAYVRKEDFDAVTETVTDLSKEIKEEKIAREKILRSTQESLVITTLENRYKDAAELLQCNRLVRNNLVPRLREFVSRIWNRIGSIFNPAQSIADFETLSQASSIRKIEEIDIGDVAYEDQFIIFSAYLDTQGNPMVKAKVVGNTSLIYDIDNVSDMAAASNVTECFALAKLEVKRRRSIMALERDVMAQVDRLIQQTKDDENGEAQKELQ